MDAVRVNLATLKSSLFLFRFHGSSGRNQTWVCGYLQYLIMFGTGIAYVITTSTCMRLSFVYGVVGKDTIYDFEDVGHNSSVRAMMDEYYVEEIDSSTKQKSNPFKQSQYNQDIRL
ncbi:hypothetical protein GIB67_015539 [Kingdonia uniflora]|uniref:Uncharacterized protein n=1 Tax=Kingdonia uniflora TaxID=39325 RepID=A0A7J7LAI9_9MAGN|nr:hypothetical protein GIB67_015539 [Kingdonia uniflora]